MTGTFRHFAINADDFRTQFEDHALLGQNALEVFCDLTVETGRDPVQEFDDGDMGTQAAPD